jgi:hypothetical protein
MRRRTCSQGILCIVSEENVSTNEKAPTYQMESLIGGKMFVPNMEEAEGFLLLFREVHVFQHLLKLLNAEQKSLDLNTF